MRELEVPSPRAGEALVEVLFSGISPGTELRCLAGAQQGTPREGFIPGYQCVGRVIECPDESLPEGQLVFVGRYNPVNWPMQWGGHVSHAVSPTDRLIPLPEGVAPEMAAFGKVAAISCHGARLAKVQPGERVAVVGLGPIGFFSAQVLLSGQAHVEAYDLSPERVSTTRQAGVPAKQIHRAEEVSAEIIQDGLFDVLIDCTGVPSLIRDLLNAGKELPWSDYSESGIRYILQGSYEGDFTVPYQAAFQREATFILPRDNKFSEIPEVLDLMAEDHVGFPESALQIRRPAEAQAVYDMLKEARALPLSVAFDWQE